MEKEKELTPEQKNNLEKNKKFLEMLQNGAKFIEFIHQDIKKIEGQSLDRGQRRRIKKALEKGRFSKEIVEIYQERVDEILAFIKKKQCGDCKCSQKDA